MTSSNTSEGQHVYVCFNYHTQNHRGILIFDAIPTDEDLQRASGDEYTHQGDWSIRARPVHQATRDGMEQA